LRKDLVLVALIVAILALMVVPLTQQILDVLITLNISLAVLLLMVAVYIKQPSDFSTFPSVILIGTAFRLALSIGTTRLILSEADGGQIIETFGDFVVAGSVAIGLVIFLIITVVQFLVVTKGAERVAEVGARFALDALPGKQMSIDADLRAGNIEQEEAVERRERLNKDSQFFGAMDGAMKFVKGDAVAGLIIILINLIGGIAVGLSIHGYSFGEAAAIYSLLTIGDGLVAQIPALIMSLCAGIIVTRATNADNVDLGSDIFKELISDPRVPAIASLIILTMGFIPGFPLAVFAISAAGLFLSSLALRRKFAESEAREAEEDQENSDQAEGENEQDAKPDVATTEDMCGRFVCVLGSSVAASLDLAVVRQEMNSMFVHLADTRGVAFAPADIRVSQSLSPNKVSIVLDEVPVYECEVPEQALMIDARPGLQELIGGTAEQIKEVEWLDGNILWVDPKLKKTVTKLKLEILDPNYKVAEFVFRLYERHLGALFSKVEFNAIMGQASAQDKEGIDALEETLSRSVLFQILRHLVEDGVPIRPIPIVIEGLTYWSQVNDGAGPAMLSECLRGSLKRQMCHAIAGGDGILGLVDSLRWKA